jgi:acyl-coenzyme A thioesterase PaaI-like protein
MERDLTNAGWTLDPDDGFVGHVGGLWRREIGGQAQLAFIARDIHANRNGVVHGGMLMTFTDRALGQTARQVTGARRGATVSLTHQFLAPVKIGDLVEITPQVTKATSRLVFMTGTAFVGDAPVISAQGVWRVSSSEG